MFKNVIRPTFYSLILMLFLAVTIFWTFNGWVIGVDGNSLGRDWLIAEVAANDEPETNFDDALDFIEDSINPTIYYGYGIVNFFLFLWLFIGRFLKVDIPGKAKKYSYIWYAIAIVGALVFIGNIYWWLYEYEGHFYLSFSTIREFCFYMFGASIVIFWIQSLLFTSRVMYVAIPLVSLFKNIFKK